MHLEMQVPSPDRATIDATNKRYKCEMFHLINNCRCRSVTYSKLAGGPPLSKTQTCKTFQLSHSLSSMGERDRSGLEFQEIATRLFVLIWRQVSTPQVVASASQESA